MQRPWTSELWCCCRCMDLSGQWAGGGLGDQPMTPMCWRLRPDWVLTLAFPIFLTFEGIPYFAWSVCGRSREAFLRSHTSAGIYSAPRFREARVWLFALRALRFYFALLSILRCPNAQVHKQANFLWYWGSGPALPPHRLGRGYIGHMLLLFGGF